MKRSQLFNRLLTLTLVLGLTVFLVGQPVMVNAQGSPNTFPPTGNVGIGTTDPLRPLHVKGNTELVALEGTTHAYIAWYPDGPATRQAYVGFGTSSNDDFTIANENVGDILLLPTSGNVGIGTTDPLRPLHVKGNTELVALEGTTHAYIAWYPDGPATRQAYVGFGTSSNDDFTIANENVGDILLLPGSGNVGIGTQTPLAPLHVYAQGTTRPALFQSNQTSAQIDLETDTGFANMVSLVSHNDGRFNVDTAPPGEEFTILRNGNVGINTQTPARRLHVYAQGTTGTALFESNQTSAQIDLETDTGFANMVSLVSHNDGRFNVDTAPPGEEFTILRNGNVGIGVAIPQAKLDVAGTTHTDVLVVGTGTPDPAAKLDVAGTTRTDVLVIDGGMDLAEPFEIAGVDDIEPGMVVAIDPDHSGQLRLATAAYDRMVAGVVSGAGGINPGIVLQQEGSMVAGSHPVALTGRVYVYADAAHGPIAPGDLLTTSDTPGHAMKVIDYERAQGAILGKAMSKLEEGTGLVLVLVTLQ